jgi:bifunctional non-homologous end joining protein LigD
MKAMLYEWLQVAELEPYLSNDEWVAEQKLDGCRLMIHVTDGKVRYLGFDGETPIAFSAAAQHFDAITEALHGVPTCVIDGELIIETGVFWAFDLPYLRDYSEPANSLHVRRYLLETLVRTLDEPRIQIVPQARTTEDKQALWDCVRTGGQEGLVLKRDEAGYAVGRRTRDVLKVKHVRSVECVVTERNRGAASNMVLSVQRDGELVEVGACSAIGKGDPPVGSIVEVEFLYWTGFRLYQPRMLRLRPDKTAEQCLYDQLAPHLVSREVVGA